MTDAPERIGIKLTEGYAHNWWGVVTDEFDEDGLEYVRADTIESLQAQLAEARAVLEAVDNWLVCAVITTPEDMYDGIPVMHEMVQATLNPDEATK